MSEAMTKSQWKSDYYDSLSESQKQTDNLLRTSLRVAVPMWLVELSTKSEEYWHKRKSVCATRIAERGDVLLFGGKTPGRAGDAFNHLAEGCALLLLITKHPFEIYDLRFETDGSVTDLRGLREENNGTFQSEAMPSLCENKAETSSLDDDRGSD